MFLIFLFWFLFLLENCLIVSVICLVVLLVCFVEVVSFFDEDVMLFMEFWMVWIRDLSEVVILLKFFLSLFNLFFDWILIVLVKFFLLICFDDVISCLSGFVMEWIISIMMMVLMIIVNMRMSRDRWRIGSVVLWILFRYIVLLIF